MVMGAQVCPDAIEGTLFAFFMQMSNSGGSYSGFFGTCKPHDNNSQWP